jgi:hypothetical protein
MMLTHILENKRANLPRSPIRSSIREAYCTSIAFWMSPGQRFLGKTRRSGEESGDGTDAHYVAVSLFLFSSFSCLTTGAEFGDIGAVAAVIDSAAALFFFFFFSLCPLPGASSP